MREEAIEPSPAAAPAPRPGTAGGWHGQSSGLAKPEIVAGLSQAGRQTSKFIICHEKRRVETPGVEFPWGTNEQRIWSKQLEGKMQISSSIQIPG